MARIIRKVNEDEWIVLVHDWEEAMVGLERIERNPDRILSMEYTMDGKSYPGAAFCDLALGAMKDRDPDLLIWATSLIRTMGETYKAFKAEKAKRRAARKRTAVAQ